MKKQLTAAGIACAALLAVTAKNADPVLMNVAGKDVHLSEFEYLFHKNNSVRNFFCELHFMGYDNHGHMLFCKLFDYL